MAAKFNLVAVVVLENNLIEHLGLEKFKKVRAGFKKTIMLPHNRYIYVNIVNKKTVMINNSPIVYYEIPRAYAQILLEKKILRDIIPNPCADNPAPGIPELAMTPYPYQIVLADFIEQQFTEERAALGAAGLILELEAGLGKTFVAAIVIARRKVKTLYIVPNEYLLEQAADDLRRAMPGLSIGRYYHKCKCDGDVVLMIINSAAAITSDSRAVIAPLGNVFLRDYIKQFTLVIYDEVHEYASKERSQVFQNIGGKYLLGLTAEATQRADKLDFVCHMNVGKVYPAESIPGFDVPETDRYTSETTILKYYGPREYCNNIVSRIGMLSAYEMSKQMIRDPYRTRLIVDLVKKFYNEGRNIFVWCDMRGIDILLCELLRAEGIAASLGDEEPEPEPSCRTVAALMGGIDKSAIEAAQNARVIVATYQYAYRGVSLPKFDTMIFATPRRAKIYQTLKRIFRAGGNTQIVRKIIDIVDMKTKLKSQLTTRKEQYVRPIFGMTINEVKVEPKNINVSAEFITKVRELSDKYIIATPQL